MQISPIEAWFPDLASAGYSVTSPPTSEYNCIAWAAGDTGRWWWPTPDPDLTYWPVAVPRERNIESFIQAFETLGFQVCETAELEEGYDKVALYADANGLPTHAARQLPSGSWTSKLGEIEDIQHETLEGLESAVYGSVAKTLRRFRAFSD